LIAYRKLTILDSPPLEHKFPPNLEHLSLSSDNLQIEPIVFRRLHLLFLTQLEISECVLPQAVDWKLPCLKYFSLADRGKRGDCDFSTLTLHSPDCEIELWGCNYLKIPFSNVKIMMTVVDDKECDALAKCCNLRKLVFFGITVHRKRLQQLAIFEDLQTIEFSFCGFVETHFMRDCKNLENLVFIGTEFSFETRWFPKLRSLSVTRDHHHLNQNPP
jgi:hypothetical protein